ncbi:MAG: S41 family peptidase [Chloroflexota bacterium]
MNRFLRVIVAALVIAAFGGGSYAAGYYSALQVAGPTAPATPAVVADQPEQFKLFWEAWNLVQKDFYKPDALDPTELTYGAIRGMLSSLKDDHTGFASPSLSQVADEDIRGSFDGIGVSVEMRDGLITVVAPIEGSPGEAAGIKPGDVIIKVDGRETASLTLLEAVALIRGPRGTTVELTIMRPGELHPLILRVTRAEIKVETVKTKMLDGNIGYVKITSFSEPTANLLADKLKPLMDQKPVGLILDLRNNPGGLLDASVDVASQFMSDGVVLYQRDRQNEKKPHPVKKGGLATNIPMVVLINKGSASASEITAGALQDSGRAKLIGEPSFGKDTVQNVHHLSDKSTVRITVSQWLTPKEQDIHEKGLQPDIVVPLTEEDYLAQRDPQLERAQEYLRQVTSQPQPTSLLREAPAGSKLVTELIRERNTALA